MLQFQQQLAEAYVAAFAVASSTHMIALLPDSNPASRHLTYASALLTLRCCRYHNVLFPITGYVCELIPDAQRDSTRVELYYEGAAHAAALPPDWVGQTVKLQRSVGTLIVTRCVLYANKALPVSMVSTAINQLPERSKCADPQ